MKKVIFLSAFCASVLISLAQKETFDLAKYNAPTGWEKKTTESALQFSTEDAAKGTYCLITLYKAVPGTANSKENFDLAWTSIVKEMVTVSTAPEMQAVTTENGWETQTGLAQFESDGNKGVALLVTASAADKMVNLIVLTNTDAFEKEMMAFLESISLKKPADVTGQIIKPVTNPAKSEQTKTTAKSDGFAFTTTNFDDGWTSTVQEDWVEVTKGTISVLLHYPKEGTIFPADPDPLIRAAWNILVAPRYSNLKNFKTTYITSYERPYIGHGYATTNFSGKEVYVVLFRQGQTGWIEITAPDKNSFIKNFNVDPDAVRWDSESALMNSMIQMANYNKFAVAASDFKGTWTSDFTGVQQLYNVYTGTYAGMNINQSNQTFQFGTGNTYNWSILAVNGMVGNIKYANVKSAGKFTVLNNWQVSFSDIEGKPAKYNAFFSCIKGARLLKFLDANYPGSGIYTVFGKK